MSGISAMHVNDVMHKISPLHFIRIWHLFCICIEWNLITNYLYPDSGSELSPDRENRSLLRQLLSECRECVRDMDVYSCVISLHGNSWSNQITDVVPLTLSGFVNFPHNSKNHLSHRYCSDTRCLFQSSGSSLKLEFVKCPPVAMRMCNVAL